MFTIVFIIVAGALFALVALLIVFERLFAARNPRHSDLTDVNNLTTQSVPRNPWWKDFETTLWPPDRSKDLEEIAPITDAIQMVNPAYTREDALRRRH